MRRRELRGDDQVRLRLGIFCLLDRCYWRLNWGILALPWVIKSEVVDGEEPRDMRDFVLER